MSTIRAHIGQQLETLRQSVRSLYDDDCEAPKIDLVKSEFNNMLSYKKAIRRFDGNRPAHTNNKHEGVTVLAGETKVDH